MTLCGDSRSTAADEKDETLARDLAGMTPEQRREALWRVVSSSLHCM